MAMQGKRLMEALAAVPVPGELKDRGMLEKLEACLDGRVAESRYARQQLLLSAGQVPEYLYYVEAGMVRGYYYDDSSGRAITLFLWREASWAVPITSFFLQQPSELYLEVNPESRLLSLSYRQVTALVEQVPAAEALLRGLLLRYCSFYQKRMQDLLTRSAWERYQDLLRTHPRIGLHASREVIASYLGITSQSLSRLIRENGHP